MMMAASVVLPDFLDRAEHQLGIEQAAVVVERERVLAGTARSASRQHERLASLRIAQHVLDERDGTSFEARECRSVELLTRHDTTP